jgi:hypothetical protein
MTAGDLHNHKDTSSKDTFYDDVSLAFGTSSNFSLKYVSADTALEMLLLADDQVLKWGNGTNSLDQWFYGNVAADYLFWDASASQLSLQGAATFNLTGAVRTVTAKTGDYTVVIADTGKVLTTLGASGAVNFTLPAVASATGREFTFVNAVDQNMTVTAPSGTMVTFNNAAATSVAFSTSSQKIGGGVRVVCDGAHYYAFPSGSNTVTVA